MVFEAAQVAWLANGSLFRMQFVLYRMHLINTFLDFHLTCGLSFAYVTTEVAICHRLSSLSKTDKLTDSTIL